MTDLSHEPEGSPLAVATAMVEQTTGVTCTAADLLRAQEAGWYVTAALNYPG